MQKCRTRFSTMSVGCRCFSWQHNWSLASGTGSADPPFSPRFCHSVHGLCWSPLCLLSRGRHEREGRSRRVFFCSVQRDRMHLLLYALAVGGAYPVRAQLCQLWLCFLGLHHAPSLWAQPHITAWHLLAFGGRKTMCLRSELCKYSLGIWQL